jgi:UDP-2-acetamido-3-amino-2,3-dideoxy-glucuronate N-acetyltransferase
MTQRSLALIGCGYWGKNLARNFRDLGVLHTLCDADQSVLAQYGAEYDGVRKCASYDDVLACEEVRQVAIAAPAAAHGELVRLALMAGKDVFVEKPLCLRADEGHELVKLAGEGHRILMVGHLLQYHPCVQRLKQMVAAGELGRLLYITSNRLNLGKIRREENALWSFAPHDISVILSLASGRLPEQIVCTGGAYLNHGVADTTLTAMRFAGGLRAHVFVSWLNPFKEQKLTVVGSEVIAVFDDTLTWAEKLILHRRYLTWMGGEVATPQKSPGERVQVTESEPLRHECEHFLDCCRTRSQPLTDGAEGVRVLRVLNAAQTSLDRDGAGTTAI